MQDCISAPQARFLAQASSCYGYAGLQLSKPILHLEINPACSTGTLIPDRPNPAILHERLNPLSAPHAQFCNPACRTEALSLLPTSSPAILHAGLGPSRSLRSPNPAILHVRGLGFRVRVYGPKPQSCNLACRTEPLFLLPTPNPAVLRAGLNPSYTLSPAVLRARLNLAFLHAEPRQSYAFCKHPGVLTWVG